MAEVIRKRRVIVWREEQRANRKSGYSSLTVHPRALARERRWWNEVKKASRLQPIQSRPDFFLTSLRKERLLQVH